MPVEGRRKVWKSGGGARSIVWVQSIPLVEIGLIVRPKTEGAKAPPNPPTHPHLRQPCSPSRLDVHAGIFRLFMKGNFDGY